MSPRARTPLVAIAAYTLLEALRNRLSWLVAGFIAAALALAVLAGSVAITETREVQSALLGATLRLGAVFTLSVFVVTSMLREAADKGVELLLSLPIRRATYVLGKFCGFALLATLIALACTLAVLPFAPWRAALPWGAALLCELLLMTALCLLVVFTFEHVTSALSAVAAFYVAARAIGAVQLIAYGGLAFQGRAMQLFSRWVVDAIAFVLPELYRFTPSVWLVYHRVTAADLVPIAAQTAVYLPLLLGAALFDFYRKNL